MNTNNSLQKVFTFNPSNQSVRVEVINNEPWFVAKDVCDVLNHSNSRVAIQMLDDDEKGVSKVYTLGGTQEMAIVNESGLYNLIFRSNKPEAKAFRKWVTSEVLPSIRKTGQYVNPYRYDPKSNAQLGEDFARLAYRELLKIDSKPTRNRLAGLIEFYVSKIKD
jgi:prophage antirepressor-like protein